MIVYIYNCNQYKFEGAIYKVKKMNEHGIWVEFKKNLKKLFYIVVLMMCIGTVIVLLRVDNEAKLYTGDYYTTEIYFKIRVLEDPPNVEDDTLQESNDNILKNIGDIYNSNYVRNKLNNELLNNGYEVIDSNDILTTSSNGKLVTLKFSSFNKEKAIFMANTFSGIVIDKLNDVLQYTSLELDESASEMSTVVNKTQKSNGFFSVENIFIIFAMGILAIIIIFIFTLLRDKFRIER